jgi:hypothetical protein
MDCLSCTTPRKHTGLLEEKQDSDQHPKECSCCARTLQKLTKRGKCPSCAKPKHRKHGNTKCPFSERTPPDEIDQNAAAVVERLFHIPPNAHFDWSSLFYQIFRKRDTIMRRIEVNVVVVAGSGTGWSLPAWREFFGQHVDVFGVDILKYQSSVETPKFDNWPDTLEYLKPMKEDSTVLLLFEWPNCTKNDNWPLQIYNQMKAELTSKLIVAAVTGTAAWLPCDLTSTLYKCAERKVWLTHKIEVRGWEFRLQFRVWVPRVAK